MMKQFIKFNFVLLLLACICLQLSGCFSFTNMTTGKSLGKNVSEVGFSVNSYGDGSEFSPPVLPQVYFTYGVTEKLDLGAHLYLGVLGLHTKYQIVGDQTSKFCIAPGLSVDYFGMFNNSSLNDYSFQFLNINVPLHMSYHPTEKFAFYFTPKYINIAYVGDSNFSNEGIFAFTPGIEVGKKFRFNAEANLLTPFGKDGNFTLGFAVISLGGKWRF